MLLKGNDISVSSSNVSIGNNSTPTLDNEIHDSKHTTLSLSFIEFPMSINASANLVLSVSNNQAAQIGGTDPGSPASDNTFVLEDAELDQISNGLNTNHNSSWKTILINRNNVFYRMSARKRIRNTETADMHR